MIDTNVRSVREAETGFTILNKNQIEAKNLCDHCGRKGRCETYQGLRQLESQRFVQTMIRTCRDYQFPIHFRDTTGTDVPMFNTVRTGDAWARRLMNVRHVSLLNSDKIYFGVAQVWTVEVVSKEGLKDFATNNHMLLHQRLDKDQAHTELLRILRNSYGKMVYENNDRFTVITLLKS